MDLQRAAQLVAERRARWLQRAAAVEALRLETLTQNFTLRDWLG